MESEFLGKVAVITGGGGVLCSTMAKALAAKGAKISQHRGLVYIVEIPPFNFVVSHDE